jgi:farnesyl diphosphate synthase
MAGGQIMDLAAEGAQLAPPELEDIYARKTGSLIHASIIMPCHCQPDQPENRYDHLERFARDVGLAFQVVDDVLDVEGSTDVIGKDHGSDIKNRKATYPSIVGLNKAKSRADDLYQDAMSRLDGIGAGTESLRWLSDFIVQRNH